jgi:hypothetical protein
MERRGIRASGVLVRSQVRGTSEGLRGGDDLREMVPTHTINASRENSGRRWDSYANTGARRLRERFGRGQTRRHCRRDQD